jgi:hypothetical protein
MTMKYTSLRTSGLSGRLFAALALTVCATSASAVRLDADGTGQALIYPYYTTRGGNQTVFSITNHSDRHKAVRVLVAEGRNGRAALALNVYLGPRDSWTSTLFYLNDNVPAALASGDDSCTYPGPDRFSGQLASGYKYKELLTNDFIGAREDAGPNLEDRLREGFIKVIEMGTLVPNTPPALAITPALSGVPANCGEVTNGWNTYWRTNSAQYLTNPTGGLSGEAYVLNVGAGTVMSYQATALADFRTDPADVPAGSRASVVLHRGAEEGVDLDKALSDPAAQMAEAMVDLPNRRLNLQYPVERAIDAVSAVLSADAVNVSYFSDHSVGATTDWVINFPTRAFYTDQARVGAEPIRPFTGLYPITGSETSAIMRVPYGLYDRGGNSIASAPTVASVDLRYSTQIIALAPGQAANTVHGRPLGSEMDIYLQSVLGGASREGGWIGLDLVRYRDASGATHTRDFRPAEDGTVMLGLPALGFAAVNYVNSNASPGVMANYSMANPQRRSQDCRRNTLSCK